MVAAMHANPSKVWLPVSLSLVMIAQSLACSVPVFRYALERWPPDAYQATIFTAGDLNDEAMRTLSYLNAAKANLHVTVVDLQQASEGQRALWEEQDSPTLPWIYVAYSFPASSMTPLLEKSSSRLSDATWQSNWSRARPQFGS